MLTLKKATDMIAERIVRIYGEREARQIARIVISESYGIPFPSLLTEPDKDIVTDGIEQIVAELSDGRPLQYVLGHTEFYGLDFIVREGALIPRPETEELVAWIAKGEPQAKTILDVGTGSGCIAIALKNALPHATVTGVDISDEALAIAAENSERLGTEISFLKADALGDMAATVGGVFDVIVSNPPYVPQSDMTAMRINVTGYEPHDALFVPDVDPLKYYRAIARSSLKMLAPSGSLYFEIYELYAAQTAEMLEEEGFCNIEIRTDINCKPRMLCCRIKR